MARTKAFDADLALERAMHLFWAQGYEATSAQDLVDALGINRSSLYATFGSKAELYHRALQLYGDRPPLSELDGDGPLAARLERALWEMVEPDLDPADARGCFACNAALERAPSDPSVRRLVGVTFGAARERLRDELHAARDRGELSSGADPDQLAASLVVTLEGLHVIAKGTGDRDTVACAIDAAVAAL